LPPAPPEQIEMGVLELIAAKPDIALDKAKAMIPSVRTSERPRHFQRMLIQLIETVIIYQFPNWSREEIERMLQVSDIRQTRVFQEAKEEVALKLIQLGRPIAEIAEATDLTPARIRSLKKQVQLAKTPANGTRRRK
jgi:predicted transposase YdaD